MARDGLFNVLVLLYLGIRLPLMRFSMVIHLRIVELISLLVAKPLLLFLGRSALDACELMNVGVNYMREHMPVQPEYTTLILMWAEPHLMLFSQQLP